MCNILRDGDDQHEAKCDVAANLYLTEAQPTQPTSPRARAPGPPR